MKKLLTLILLSISICSFGQAFKKDGKGVIYRSTFRSKTLPAYYYRYDDASTQYSYYRDTLAYIDLTDTFTVCVYTKNHATTGNEFVIGKPINASISGRWAIYWNNDDIRFFFQHVTAVTSTALSGYTDGKFHNVTLTWCYGEKARFYIDGLKVDSIDISAFNFVSRNDYDLTVCGRQNISKVYDAWTNGEVSTVRAWQRKLSDLEAMNICFSYTGDEYAWWIAHPDGFLDVSGNVRNMTNVNFDANSYVTESTADNPMNRYGYYEADSIPFDASTIDGFGTAKNDINGNVLPRKMINQ